MSRGQDENDISCRLKHGKAWENTEKTEDHSRNLHASVGCQLSSGQKKPGTPRLALITRGYSGYSGYRLENQRGLNGVWVNRDRVA